VPNISRTERVTIRCARYIDSAGLLRRLGASTNYIRRHSPGAPTSVVDQAIQNFSEVWIGPPTESRYSDGTFSVLYTATKEEVATIERVHWLVELVFKAMRRPLPRPIVLYLYYCGVKGKYLNYTKRWKNRREFVHPTKYVFCHQIARSARARAIQFLLVPSARRFGGCCVPVFDQAATRFRAVISSFEVFWDPAKGKAYILNGSRKRYLTIDNVYASV
jgi:hypothetical protein